MDSPPAAVAHLPHLPYIPDKPDEPSKGYFTIPNEFIDCGNLGKLGPAVATYLVLLRHAGSKSRCWLKIQTIAARTNSSDRTVQLHIAHLVKVKAITVKYRKRGATTFSIVVRKRLRPMGEENCAPKKNTLKKGTR